MKTMKKIIICVVVLTVFALTFSSCSYFEDMSALIAQTIKGQDKTDDIPVNEAGEAAFAALVAEFEEKGYTVNWEALEPMFLSAARRVILLNEGEVALNVFVYDNAEKAAEEASYFTEDGINFVSEDTSIEISWTYPPHLYLHDQLIILYAGDSADGVALCTEMFGEQFAGAAAEAE